MYLKRYRRPTVHEALAAAREELGPAALVLSTDLVPAGGWRGLMGVREVQITAAAEREVSEPRPRPAAGRHQESRPTDVLVARLTASGLERSLAEAVAAAVPAAELRAPSVRTLRDALAGQLADLTSGEEPMGRAEIFVGPPGVGKTTTIAKIAARERAARGRSLGVVAADGFRAGAVEQLRIYADIIGAPFRIARNSEELERAINASRSSLLVDTAGRSPNDPAVRDLLQLIRRRRGIRTHLVLAADTSPASARRILQTYESAEPDRLVITKVDECETLSPLVSVLRERQLPVSFLTAGQRVPEDLDRATPALLAGAVLQDS